MLRSAAKNHAGVAVVVDPADYDKVLEELRATAKNHARTSVVVDPAEYAALLDALQAGGTTAAMRRAWAAKAYAHTAAYDGQIAMWLSPRAEDPAEPKAWPRITSYNVCYTKLLRAGSWRH